MKHIKIWFENGESVIFEDVDNVLLLKDTVEFTQRDQNSAAVVVFQKDRIAGYKRITKY